MAKYIKSFVCILIYIYIYRHTLFKTYFTPVLRSKTSCAQRPFNTSSTTFNITPGNLNVDDKYAVEGAARHLTGLVVLLLDALHLHLPEHAGLRVGLAQITVVNDTWGGTQVRGYCAFRDTSNNRRFIRVEIIR